MVWKKVSNSDAGDSSHFGGDDIDKISDTFNAGTQTDPINIKDVNLYVVDPADTSKKVRFDAGGVASSQTRVITLPNADITIGVASSSSVAGLMSTAQFDKLDGIEANATADQTGGQIKTLYESETNAFTDTLFTKLDGIEASADVTDTTNVNAAGALMLTDTTTAGLGIVIDEDAMGSDSATKVPTQQSVKAYVDTAVASNITLKGTYDANADDPSLDDGTPISGILTGDHYVVSDAGDFFAEAVQAGDSIIAKQDSPTQLTHWIRVNNNLVASSVLEANIADNAVTLAKMAPGTDGNLITYDASGNPAHVPTGNNNQVLTSNGAGAAPTFQDAAEASPLTAKGDIYVYGTGNTKLAVSTTDGQVLKADSTATTGLAWGDGGGVAIDVGFSNTTAEAYRGSLAAGGSPTHSIGDNIATRALGTPREMYIRKIDANNEGVFTVIHKNGTLTEVQIA